MPLAPRDSKRIKASARSDSRSASARRGLRLPGLLLGGIWNLALGRQSLLQTLERLGPGLPAGLFSNQAIDSQLTRLFARPGRSNDFRQLKTRLTIVATDLDTGAAAPFGQPGFDHVPISKAVQARAALPGLFPPVDIGGRSYVDGALKKTLHASVALQQGVDLMLCINPLVPFDTAPSSSLRSDVNVERRSVERGPTAGMRRIASGGLPAVLSQTFRSLIHSRMDLGMRHYQRAYPDTDILLFEPDHRDARLHLANVFSYRHRRAMAELAYQRTRAYLRAAPAELGEKLERHGIRINQSLLSQSDRSLMGSPSARKSPADPLGRLHRSLERLEERVRRAGVGIHANAVLR